MREGLIDVGLTTSDQPARWYPPVHFEFSPATDITSSRSLCVGGYMASWVFEAAKKLEKLGRLPRGWDSHGGLSLNPDARRLTLNVLDWLGTTELPVPGVVLGSGGTVNLEWHGKGKELEVGLGKDQGIEFLKVYSHGNLEEGTEKSNLPAKIRGLATWFLRE